MDFHEIVLYGKSYVTIISDKGVWVTKDDAQKLQRDLLESERENEQLKGMWERAQETIKNLEKELREARNETERKNSA